MWPEWRHKRPRTSPTQRQVGPSRRKRPPDMGTQWADRPKALARLGHHSAFSIHHSALSPQRARCARRATAPLRPSHRVRTIVSSICLVYLKKALWHQGTQARRGRTDGGPSNPWKAVRLDTDSHRSTLNHPPPPPPEGREAVVAATSGDVRSSFRRVSARFRGPSGQFRGTSGGFRGISGGFWGRLRG